MKWRSGFKVALLLAIATFCLFGFMLDRQSSVYREFEAALLSVNWMLLICLAVWCGCFLLLTFSIYDLPLIGLLLIAISALFIGYAETSRATDAIILLAGVTLGKGARVLLRLKAKGEMLKEGEERLNPPSLRFGAARAESGNMPEFSIQISEFRIFLVGLVVLLAFSSWWRLDMSDNFYHGPRWMGLWDNPNIYGMLMGAGLLLAIGLLAGNVEGRMKNEEAGGRKSNAGWNFLRCLRSFAAIDSIILFIAAGMMGTGLLFSYSRGAWLGTAIGLLYLAKAHGKFKWRFVLPGVFVVAAIVCVFWHSTVDTAPWYVKRLDFGRPSAQHRVAAWNAAFQMMRDHPFGVGWNKAVETYDKNYSPPEDGAAAITTNDYLMLGTQLGIPGLVCFVAYVGLCLRVRAGNPLPAAASPYKSRRARSDAPYQTACRAGAVTMLVAFWFDGGLFKLATAAVFWILLELGVERGRKIEAEQQKAENSSPCPSPHPTRRGESLLRALRSFVAIKSAFDIRHSEINQSLVTLAATK